MMPFMNVKWFALMAWLLGMSLIHAAQPAAGELLAKAEKNAAEEGKAIYVHFGASWCGWCKRHDAFLEQPTVKPVFEKYFVPVKIVVQENAQNKALENPGAEESLKKFGGPEGLPFLAFLDAKGALIVNSMRVSEKGVSSGNIGHPSAPEEIDWFVAMMKKAAPKMAAEDLKVIESALRSPKK
jgi:thiol-disulfide isomerase/thioredoxin